MAEFLDQAQAILQHPRLPLIAGLVVAALAGLCILPWLYRKLFSTPKQNVAANKSLQVNLGALGDFGPIPGRWNLECYNVPVRLAVVVLAPLGREGVLPDDLLPLLDDVVPGLRQVARQHDSVVLRWPYQLSSQGFMNNFFSLVPLPGDHGRGTPWCSLVGRVEGTDQSFLAGMALCAAKPNNVSELQLPHSTAWLDVLRVPRPAG